MDNNTALPQKAPEDHRAKRDGDRDLAFSGWLLGKAEHGSGGTGPKEWTRGTEVWVYLTTGRRIVTAVRQWKRGQEDHNSYRAAAHETPGDALLWLKNDAGGELGFSSKNAWEEACRAWQGLEGEDVERVK